MQDQDSMSGLPREVASSKRLKGSTRSKLGKMFSVIGLGRSSSDDSDKPPEHDHDDWEAIIERQKTTIIKLNRQLEQKEKDLLSEKRRRDEWETHANDLMSKHTDLKSRFNERVTEYNKLVQSYNQLQAKVNTLNDEKIKYREKLQQQASIISKNEKEVRQLQEAEFVARSTKTVISHNHEKMTSDLENLFNAVLKWSRFYFKAPKTGASCNFDSLHTVAPEFAKLLCECSRDAKRLIDGSQCPKIQFLVEAAVNQFLVQEIFTNPFGFCEPGTKEICALMFDSLKKVDESRAQRWRAITIGAAETIEAPKDIDNETYRLNAEQIVTNLLLRILQPIMSSIGNELSQDMIESCRAFTTTAIKISRTLNCSAAGLVLIDRAYFEQHGWQYRRGMETYRARLDDGDAESYVELIIRPGFFKRGDDNGENFGVTAPWIQAIVETREVEPEVPNTPQLVQEQPARGSREIEDQIGAERPALPPGSYDGELGQVEGVAIEHQAMPTDRPDEAMKDVARL